MVMARFHRRSLPPPTQGGLPPPASTAPTQNSTHHLPPLFPKKITRKAIAYLPAPATASIFSFRPSGASRSSCFSFSSLRLSIAKLRSFAESRTSSRSLQAVPLPCPPLFAPARPAASSHSRLLAPSVPFTTSNPSRPLGPLVLGLDQSRTPRKSRLLAPF